MLTYWEWLPKDLLQLILWKLDPISLAVARKELERGMQEEFWRTEYLVGWRSQIQDLESYIALVICRAKEELEALFEDPTELVQCNQLNSAYWWKDDASIDWLIQTFPLLGLDDVQTPYQADYLQRVIRLGHTPDDLALIGDSEEFTLIYQTHPEAPYTRYMAFLIKTGQSDQCRELLRKKVQIEPQQIVALVVSMNQGSLLRSILEIYPIDPMFLYVIATYLSSNLTNCLIPLLTQPVIEVVIQHHDRRILSVILEEKIPGSLESLRQPEHRPYLIAWITLNSFHQLDRLSPSAIQRLQAFLD